MLKARFVTLYLIMANAVLILAAGAYSEEAQSPNVRKLGKHHLRSIAATPSPAPSPAESGGVVEEEVMESNHQHRHHHSVHEKSIAGGGAIIGALATLFLVAIFCYIRATRRRHVIPGSPTDSSSKERKTVESTSRVHS